jgi:hypothetical protein
MEAHQGNSGFLLHLGEYTGTSRRSSVFQWRWSALTRLAKSVEERTNMSNGTGYVYPSYIECICRLCACTPRFRAPHLSPSAALDVIVVEVVRIVVEVTAGREFPPLSHTLPL